MPNKLIIQIPCYNEEDTLAATIAQLPKTLSGFDQVEILVINDGSTDNTAKVAKNAGAHHILSLPQNKGLAQAFAAGMQHALELGADIIVNTDGDNQYNAEDIPALIAPIVNKQAQIVIGTRPINDIEDFSPIKKKLQKLGSWVVRQLSGTRIIDTTSGFRAIERSAAQRLQIHTRFSYTVEMIIQAGFANIPMTCIPIRVRPVERPSRLMKNIAQYIFRQIITMAQLCWRYRPLRMCVPLSALLAATALILNLLAHGPLLYHTSHVVLLMAIMVFFIGLMRHIWLHTVKKAPL